MKPSTPKFIGLRIQVFVDVRELAPDHSIEFARWFSADCDRFELPEPYAKFNLDAPEVRVDHLEVWVTPAPLVTLGTILNYLLESCPHGDLVDVYFGASSWGSRSAEYRAIYR